MVLMGIETPESYGGAGAASFKPASRSKSSAASTVRAAFLVDVQNTLVTNAFLKWADDVQKKKYLRFSPRDRRLLRPLRERQRL